MPQFLFPENTYFPQCHASCLLPLTDSHMLCAFFAGTHEKHNDVGIWLSEFDEKHWLPPRLVAKVSDEPHWNPVLFHTAHGIRLVFKVGAEIRSWRSYTMLSIDGGKNWSLPIQYPASKAVGPVRSKPLLLSNNFLLAPSSEEEGNWLPYVDLSTNDGCTFERFSAIPINQQSPEASDYLSGRGAIQPTLWESAPGNIHALLRTSAGYIYRSDSTDYGYTWCCAYPLELPNNNSGIDIDQASNGMLYLACNPVRGDFAARTPLCIYVSNDNATTFSLFSVIDNTTHDPLTGHTAEFSYPSLAIQNNHLFLTYTWNRRTIAFWSQELK